VVVQVLHLHRVLAVRVDLAEVEVECGQVHLLVLPVQEHKHHLVDLLHLRVMVELADQLIQLEVTGLAQVVEEQIQQELLVVL
jgi:hypothetical protein